MDIDLYLQFCVPPFLPFFREEGWDWGCIHRFFCIYVILWRYMYMLDNKDMAFSFEWGSRSW